MIVQLYLAVQLTIPQCTLALLEYTMYIYVLIDQPITNAYVTSFDVNTFSDWSSVWDQILVQMGIYVNDSCLFDPIKTVFDLTCVINLLWMIT